MIHFWQQMDSNSQPLVQGHFLKSILPKWNAGVLQLLIPFALSIFEVVPLTKFHLTLFSKIYGNGKKYTYLVHIQPIQLSCKPWFCCPNVIQWHMVGQYTCHDYKQGMNYNQMGLVQNPLRQNKLDLKEQIKYWIIIFANFLTLTVLAIKCERKS